MASGMHCGSAQNPSGGSRRDSCDQPSTRHQVGILAGTQLLPLHFSSSWTLPIVEPTGFEPATNCLTNSRSAIELQPHPTMKNLVGNYIVRI